VAREHWLNADFDLSLRPRWPGLAAQPSLARRIRELEVHALPLARPGDSVRLHEHPGSELLELLESVGLLAPTLTFAPALRPGAELSPFGWNDEADRLARGLGQVSDHPRPDVVRRVNGRSFAASLEAELGEPARAAAACRSVDELAAALARAPHRGQGWVAKAEHGNAALGNRRLRTRRLGDADRRWAESVLAEDDLVHLEAWLPRVADLTAVFEVLPSGAVRGVAVHEVVSTADGAFLGALFAPRPGPESAQWWAGMERAAEETARALAAAGYWGPACMDGVVWRDRGSLRLRALTDLNARGNVSAGGRALVQRLDPGAAALWRFYSVRKLHRFDSLAALVHRIGRDALDPRRRRGALPTSPLWLEGEGRRRRPGKLAVLLLADSPEEALALDARVREKLER